MDIDPVLAGMGVVSLLPAYLTLESSSAGMAITVFLLSFATLFMARSTGPLGALSTFTNPFVTFFTILSVSFIYFAMEGGIFWTVALKSIGAGFLGGAVSMMIFNYWNIG